MMDAKPTDISNNAVISVNKDPNNAVCKVDGKNVKHMSQKLRKRHKRLPLGEFVSLVRKGLKIKEIAKILDVDQTTVSRRLHKLADEIRDVDAFKTNKPVLLQILEARILKNLTQDSSKINNLDPKSAVKILRDLHKTEHEELGTSTKSDGVNVYINLMSKFLDTPAPEPTKVIDISPVTSEDP